VLFRSTIIPSEWVPPALTGIDTRYALIEPYAYANIRWDAGTQELRYNIIEPPLTAEERGKLDKLKTLIIDLLDINLMDIRDMNKVKDYLYEKVSQVVADYEIQMTEVEYNKVLYYIYRDFLGLERLEPLIQDPEVSTTSTSAARVIGRSLVPTARWNTPGRTIGSGVANVYEAANPPSGGIGMPASSKSTPPSVSLNETGSSAGTLERTARSGKATWSSTIQRYAWLRGTVTPSTGKVSHVPGRCGPRFTGPSVHSKLALCASSRSTSASRPPLPPKRSQPLATTTATQRKNQHASRSARRW
jgi:hypothetical protein